MLRTDTSWLKTDMADLHYFNEKIKKHEKCAKHLKSMCNLGMLRTVDIKTQISLVYRQELNRHNENVKKI